MVYAVTKHIPGVILMFAALLASIVAWAAIAAVVLGF